MAQYLSEDLRVRVIRAVEGGMSRNAAVRRSGRIEAQADLLLGGVEEAPDITLAELRERLIAERGETFAISTIHGFFRRRGITYKNCRSLDLIVHSASGWARAHYTTPPVWPGFGLCLWSLRHGSMAAQ